MGSPDPETGRVRGEAAAWLARLRADDADDADRAAFQAWAEADPAHRAAFDRATRLFETVGGLGDLGGRPRARAERPAASRRVLLSGLAAALAGGAGLWGWRDAAAQEFRTERGRSAAVRLKDGSRLQLDALSAARFEPWPRRLSLQAGRIQLEIAPGGRPLVLESGPWRATAGGGACQASLLDGDFTFLMLEGEAAVRRGDGPTTLVRSGQRFTPAGVDRPALEPLVAWREGQLVFEAVTLAEACETFNRYGGEQLEADPRVAHLQVSGVYAMQRGGAFARDVERLYGLRLRPVRGGLRLEPAE